MGDDHVRYWAKENNGVIISKGASGDEVCMLGMREISKEEFDSITISRNPAPTIQELQDQLVAQAEAIAALYEKLNGGE